MRVRLLAAALCALAVAACGHGGNAPPAITRASAAPRSTPLGPPRWTVAQAAAIRATLAADLANPVLARSGALVVIGGDGTPLFMQRPSTPMAPASTIKTIVAATSLYDLGPHARLSTTLESLDPPDDEGRIGPLFLVGGGDPVLTSDDLRAGVGALHRAGVRAVDGDVIVDATAFGGPEINPLWEADDLPYGYAAGVSAISLDQGTVEFTITPTSVGAPAEVRVDPPNADVVVHGAVITAYSTDLQIDRAPTADTFTLGGQIAAGAPQEFWQPVIDMPAYAGGALAGMLVRSVIAFSGSVKVGVAPIAAHVLWDHASPSLAKMVRQMCVESNNHIAEQLLRVLGAQHGVGTVASGERIERAFLQRRGISTAGLHIVDGSGLSPADRVTAKTIAELLYSVGDDPSGRAFVAALPLAGVEGTVRYHALDAAAGRVRAKSGHIAGVSGLVGYVTSRHHGRIVFAFLVNDPAAWDDRINDAEDRALDDLSRT